VRNDESSDEFSLLIREILTYVVKHPDAKDTVDGIHKFWLSSKTVHQSRNKIREVLEFLAEERGWLTKKVTGASVTLYGLNKDRFNEIQNFVRDQ
jgi:hypothetical protein